MTQSTPTSHTDRAFELRNIARKFDQKLALGISELDLDSRTTKGELEVVTFVGKNGAGKSTLLYLLALLDEQSDQTGASLKVNGEETTNLSQADKDKIRWHYMGIAFQNTCLLPHLTVGENITISCELRGIEKDETFYQSLLEALSLKALENLEIDQLSNGQRRRVALARAMINKPEILFLDEPTESMDPLGIRWIQQFLKNGEIAGYEPRVVILITHDITLASSTGTYFKGLREGKLSTIEIDHDDNKSLAESNHQSIQNFLNDVSHQQEEAVAVKLSGYRRILGSIGTLGRYAWSNVFHGSRNRWDTFVQAFALVAMVLATLFMLKIMVSSATIRYEDLSDPYYNQIKVSRVTGVRFTEDDVKTLSDIVVKEASKSSFLETYVADKPGIVASGYPKKVYAAQGVRTVDGSIFRGIDESYVDGITIFRNNEMVKKLKALGIIEYQSGRKLAFKPFGEQGESLEQALNTRFEGAGVNERELLYHLVIVPEYKAKAVLGLKVMDQIPWGKTWEKQSRIKLQSVGPTKQNIKIIVVDFIPDGHEFLIGEQYYEREFYNANKNTSDPLPPYAYITVFLNSLFETNQVIEAIELLNEKQAQPRYKAELNLKRELEQANKKLRVLGFSILAGLITTVCLTLLAMIVISEQRVRRRSRDIGVLRAIGATKWWVFKAFLLEGFLIWFVSAVFALGIHFAFESNITQFILELLKGEDDFNETMPIPDRFYLYLMGITYLMTFTGALTAFIIANRKDHATNLRGEI